MTPRTLDASFRLVTPAFLSGAPDGGARPAALRVPSLLGLLRFWWRALAWREAAAAADPLATLRKCEASLFGAAGKGQGRVLASLHAPCPRPHEPAPEPGGAFYLAGQGLKGRQSLGAGTTFTLRFTVRPRASADAAEDRLDSLARALRCLGLLGGVGARGRHGYGSLRLLSLTDSDGPLGWTEPADLPAYQTELRSLLEGSWPAAEPPFTAFSKAMRLTLIPADERATIADFMEAQGHLIQHYRSKGRQDGSGVYKVNGEDARDHATHPFRADFTWFCAHPKGKRDDHVPERAMFGLPHNYFSKRQGNKKVEVKAVIPDDATGPAKSDRRASPLFLHFHALPNGRLVAAWLFLPARFLPDVNGRRPQVRIGETPVDYTPSWQPITGFLDDLAAQAGAVALLP